MGKIDFDKILSLDEEPLKEMLDEELRSVYEEVVNQDGFLYAKGEIPVLLVAHLDTVHKNLAPPICKSADGRFIMSPHGIGGDDRCGVYMILKLIKELKCHVLFCEEEESGCKGAIKFTKTDIKPDVNYILEFDRKGSIDSVFYDCDNKLFEEFVNSVGFVTSTGSCSDISKVAPHLGIAAVNLSSGYYNQHALHEFIDMKFVEENIVRAKELILKDHLTKYEYVKKTYTYWSGNKNNNRNVCGKNTTKDKFGKAPANKIIIRKLLMEVNQDLCWIYEKRWGDAFGNQYYIDANLDVYIKVGNECVLTYDVSIIDKTTMYPPEFIMSKAVMQNVLS